MWKKAVVAYLRHCPGGTEKTQKNLKVVGVLAVIRIANLPNRSMKGTHMGRLPELM
jgi:hypothetical protein